MVITICTVCTVYTVCAVRTVYILLNKTTIKFKGCIDYKLLTLLSYKLCLI